MSSATNFPNVLWAQRNDLVYLTVDVPNLKKETCDIKLEPSKLSFTGTDDHNHTYAFSLEFFQDVDVDQSTFNIQPRQVEFKIQKKEFGPYWDRLQKGSTKLHFVKCDWGKWKDEDEQDENENYGGFGSGMDFSQFGGAGGADFGGGEDADSDDEDDAVPGLEDDDDAGDKADDEEEEAKRKAAEVSPPD